MKKILSTIVLVAVAALLVIGLCACQPAKIEQVEGTYELVTFSRSYPDKMPEVEEGQTPPEQTYTKHDYIKEASIKAYLVVKKDGTGYAVYSDSQTELFVRAIKITFNKDSDHPDKINTIVYTDGTNKQSNHTAVSRGIDDIPGTGAENLYVNAGKEMQLKRSDPMYDGLLIHRNYAQDVVYKKIGGETDLSLVNKKLSKNLASPVYELQGLDREIAVIGGYYDDTFPYVYFGMRIDPAAQTATLYYAEKTDGIEVVRQGQPVTYRVDETTSRFILTVNGREYYSYVAGNNGSYTIATSLNYDVPREGMEPASYGLYGISDRAGYIAEQKAAYDEMISRERGEENNG